MNSTLFAKEFRANAFVVGIIVVVVALYIAMVVSMFDPALGESLDVMMQSMPEVFAAFGMAQPSSTLLEFMLNYLYGFLLTMFPLVLVLIMVNKLVVRYVDRGTMAYLLATPNSRLRIVATLAGVLVAMLVVVMVATVALGWVCAEVMFPGDLDVAGFLRANAGLFALWVCMAGLCFLSACAFSHAGAALWVGGGACILAFVVQMIGQVGDKFDFLKNATFLTLYDAYGLAAGEGSAYFGAAVLLAAGVAMFAVGVALFCRRNLSI